jgi:hypothetical protein
VADCSTKMELSEGVEAGRVAVVGIYVKEL